MTDERMPLRGLMGKSADADRLREMIGAAVRLMDLAVGWPDAEAARQQWRRVADQLRPKVPKLAALMDTAEPDLLPSSAGPPWQPDPPGPSR